MEPRHLGDPLLQDVPWMVGHDSIECGKHTALMWRMEKRDFGCGDAARKGDFWLTMTLRESLIAFFD